MKNKCYSLDGVEYHTDYQSIIDNIDTSDADLFGVVYYYEADEKSYTHSDFVDDDVISSMIERIGENAYEVADEWVGNYMVLTDEQFIGLKALVLNYLNDKVAQPTFYTAVNVEKKKLLVEDLYD